MKLKYPIDIDGERVEELGFKRRPLARDSRDAVRQARRTGDDSEASREIHLFANLLEVSPETIEAMDMADYGRLQTEYLDFLAA